jgi:hypothetical protein
LKKSIACGVFAFYFGSLSLLANAEDVEFSEEQICRAAVAVLHAVEPSEIKIDGQNELQVVLSYVRPDDQTVWRTKCKTSSEKIIWGNLDGRWRTHVLDEKLSYFVVGSEITIFTAYTDGTKSENRFELVDFNTN